MSKKDYVLIAHVLKNNEPRQGPVVLERHDSWRQLCRDFATMLRDDNIRFNERKFLSACKNQPGE